MNTAPFPDLIKNLPEAEIPVAGVRGWLLQGDDTQAVFFEIESTAQVPPHAHCAQWGIVVDGEMDLTIGDDTRTYGKGDSYFIPEGVVHAARFRSRVLVIDLFAAADRYRAKSK